MMNVLPESKKTSDGDSVVVKTESISEIVFVLESQNEISISYDNSRKEVFRSHGENDTFWNNGTEIERCYDDILCKTSIVTLNCQEAAWTRFKNLLESQNNTIDSLVFHFKVAHNPQNFNFPPSFSPQTIQCNSLKMTGKRDYWIVYAITGACKPCLRNLYVDQIGYPYNLSTEFGKKVQVKTAIKLFCTIAMKEEEVMNLEGSDISIDPLYFDQCFVVNLMKKSIKTGAPKKFRVFRGGKNPESVLKNFNSCLWTSELAENFKLDYDIVPGCHYYLVNLSNYSTSLFIEFCNGRRDVYGFILDEK